MKKIILFWLLMCSLGALYAQSAGNCVQGISTDPNNPVTSNPGTDPVFHANTFDWRQEWYPVRPTYSCSLDSGGMHSPFFDTNFDGLLGIRKGSLSDFQPADGWELVKRDMGFLMLPSQMSYNSGPTSNGGNFLRPYLMLYNRFRGVLRVIAAVPFNIPGQEIVISLKLRNDLGSTYTGYTFLNGLLSQGTAVAQPLDKPTSVRTISSATDFPDLCNVFFYANFHLGYDPCVCHFKSMLDVTFDWVESSTFGAVGQSVGVSRDLADALGSGFDPKKFLANFWARPTPPPFGSNSFDSLRSGTYIHTIAWELYDAHRQKEEIKGNFTVAGALYFLATAAKVGSVLADKGAAAPVVTVSAGTASFGEIGSSAIAAATVTVEEAKKFNLEKALKVAAPILDFLSSEFKQDKPAQMMPMAIESELALRGRIEKTTGLEAMTIRIGVPGSLAANSLPEEDDIDQPAFPTYNEALGRFALLETPTLKWSEEITGFRFCDPIGFGNPPLTSYPIHTRKFRYEGDLKYVFNPVLGVNEAKTKIFAALEIKTSSSSVTPVGTLPIGNKVYSTPLVPPSCLNFLTIENITYPEDLMCEPPMELVFLKILILFEFNELDSNGQPYRSELVVKYPLNWIEVPPASIPPTTVNIPIERFLNTQHFTSQVPDIEALETIMITGNLTAAPGVQVIIRAPEIIVPYNYTIGPGITLISGYPNVCSTPTQQTPLGSFCTDGRYQANAANKTDEGEPVPVSEPGLSSHSSKSPLSAYPNPFTQDLTLAFTLDAPGTTSARLIDHLGRQVMQLWENQSAEAGAQEHTFNLSSLPAGLYLAVLETSQGRQTIRIVKE